MNIDVENNKYALQYKKLLQDIVDENPYDPTFINASGLNARKKINNKMKSTAKKSVGAKKLKEIDYSKNVANLQPDGGMILGGKKGYIKRKAKAGFSEGGSEGGFSEGGCMSCSANILSSARFKKTERELNQEIAKMASKKALDLRRKELDMKQKAMNDLGGLLAKKKKRGQKKGAPKNNKFVELAKKIYYENKADGLSYPEACKRASKIYKK